MKYQECRRNAVLRVILLSLNLTAFFVQPAEFTGAQEVAKAQALPSDLATFVTQARTALDSGQPGSALASAPPDALQWRGHPGSWHLNVLTQPDFPERLAVFSRFHAPQFDGDHVYRLARSAAGWQYGPEIPETETNGYRVRDHRIAVRFDAPHGGVALTDEVTIERSGNMVAPCYLRLSCDMQTDRLSVDGHSQQRVQSAPGLIAVLPPSDRRFCIVRLEYHRVQDSTGGDPISPNGAILAAYWYPHIARLPARCGVTVTVPHGWTAVGQGELMLRKEAGSESTFTYRNKAPTSYFFLVAGPYSVTSRTVEGRRLSVYQTHSDPAQANEALDQLAKVLAFYEARFGPFPFRHYELVETPGNVGVALEAYSFAMFGGGDFSVLPHELAHSWWGGLVPNPYTRSLWSESFAEYSQMAYMRQAADWKPASLHPAPDYGRRFLRTFTMPIAESPNLSTPAYSTAGYVKGPLVLLMLEDLIGTDAMMHSLHRFRDKHVPGEAANWPDFQRAVQKVTGRDYGWFFDQWLRRTGVPQVRLTDVKSLSANGRFMVTAQVTQAGTPYRLRLPVVLKTASGEAVRQDLETSGSATPLRITSKSAPLHLELDPDGAVLMAGIVEGEKEDPFAYTFPVTGITSPQRIQGSEFSLL